MTHVQQRCHDCCYVNGDREGLQIACVLSIYWTAFQPGTSGSTTDATVESLQGFSCCWTKRCQLQQIQAVSDCIFMYDEMLWPSNSSRRAWTFQSRFCVFGIRAVKTTIIGKSTYTDSVSLGLIRAIETTISGKSTYTKARNTHAIVVADFSVIVVFTAPMSPKRHKS